MSILFCTLHTHTHTLRKIDQNESRKLSQHFLCTEYGGRYVTTGSKTRLSVCIALRDVLNGESKVCSGSDMARRWRWRWRRRHQLHQHTKAHNTLAATPNCKNKLALNYSNDRSSNPPFQTTISTAHTQTHKEKPVHTLRRSLIQSIRLLQSSTRAAVIA